MSFMQALEQLRSIAGVDINITINHHTPTALTVGASETKFKRVDDDIQVTHSYIADGEFGKTIETIKGWWQRTHLWNYRFVNESKPGTVLTNEIMKVILAEMEAQNIVYHASLHQTTRQTFMASISVR